MTTRAIQKIETTLAALEAASAISKKTIMNATKTLAIQKIQQGSNGITRDAILHDEKLADKYDDVWYPIFTSDTDATNRVRFEFNVLPSVPDYHRSHGRTTLIERIQIGYFSEYICPKFIAAKFNVSLPTVYLYSKKYGKISRSKR